jgi:hypothetical protein
VPHAGLVFEALGQIDRARSAFKQAEALPTSIAVTGAIGPVTESFRREQDTARTRLAALGDSAAAPSSPLTSKVAAAAPGATVAPASPSLGRRIALVIGNGAHANAPQLVNPANDARVIAKNLRDMGFEVSDGIDLDRAAMTRLIADFLRAAATANTAVLFYAGHGVQIDGQNYLLPVDVKFNGVSDLTTEMTNVSAILAGLDDRIRANIVTWLNSFIANRSGATLCHCVSAPRRSSGGSGHTHWAADGSQGCLSRSSNASVLVCGPS